MKLPKNFTRVISFSLLLLSLSSIYLKTVAPNLTWANGGSDGGDLITAAATGGIAHPSGYPLYLILARFFQLFPVGSLAFRTNLMSAFFAVLAAFFVYAIVFRYLLVELDEYTASIAGLSAGFAIGLSPLFWSQAVITEVYTLHAFFIALIVYITVFPIKKKKQSDRWQGLIYGLAASNHLTALLLIPAALMLNALNHHSATQKIACSIKNSSVNWKSLGRQLIWMLVGLSIYALLPLRAMKQPVINWGNPVNLENFWWLISGKIYRAYYFQDALASLWSRVEASASLLLDQFGILGITLGFIGIILFYRKSKIYILTIWMAMIFSGIAIIYQTPDSYLYFIPTLISFSVWIGISVGFSLKYLQKQKPFLQPLFLAVLIISLLLGTIKNWKEVDASQDNRAESFVREVFELAPENAIVFAEGDQAIFALWYFHFALEERTDLIVLATDLLHYDWYQASMKKKYPSLVLPGPFPFPTTVVVANPARDICYVRYNNQAEILCENPRER